MDKNKIQLFSNDEFGSLRALLDENGEPLFVASDVAKALGYRMASDLTRRLDEDEKGTRSVRTPGGEQEVSVVTEPGLYNAILGSKVPGAKQFKRWVTHEVLPVLMHGGRLVPREETREETLARAFLLANDTIEEQKTRIAEQKERISELEPKALFADAVAASDGTCLVGELAKMLRQNGVQVGQNRLFAMLREDGFLGTVGSHWNMPTQKSMERDLFRIKESLVFHADGHSETKRTPKVTGKGQVYFMRRYGAQTSLALS